MSDRKVEICLSPVSGWVSENGIHARCHDGFAKKLAAPLRQTDCAESIAEMLRQSDDYSGGIIETEQLVFAWADHIRSYPVYYAVRDDVLYIGNEARKVRDRAGVKDVDPVSATEFSMAGYIAGAHTLYKDLRCLQPGEFLVWDKDQAALSLHRYYRYIPKPLDEVSFEEYADRFDALLNRITQKIIDRYDGRTFAFPLSAGLDSRALLCKFHELGYEHIVTFTYGPSFNFEAQHAKKIAAHLGVPWHFIKLSGKQCRTMFDSEQRKGYWDYAVGYKAAASMREYTALKYLYDSEIIPRDAVMINGQSGDYITGGHIAPRWHKEQEKLDKSALLSVLYDKHYSLWPALKTPENLAVIAERIEKLSPLPEGKLSAPEWAVYEEIWEYDARQICLVAHGQRSYEYFGYEWEMPLWEKSLVDFFEPMPMPMKYGQRFYKEYLRRYDYKGLFSKPEPHIWRWPVPMLWVVPAARIIGMLGGAQAKKDFYARMKYFGHYANQYAFFPLGLHLETATKARNIFSLYVRRWIEENDVPFPEHLTGEMDL
ncbi:MAG: hypothetical protein H6867_07450 [Rhodospirillales bacterium]|nr:hypothetical protein [Rhodospirillales bacterium]MCB9995387.1 hypothetical protein [Rhodospirillales bacterium]